MPTIPMLCKAEKFTKKKADCSGSIFTMDGVLTIMCISRFHEIVLKNVEKDFL